MDEKEKHNQLSIEYIPILKVFKYIFPEEILRLPLKRDIDFTIDLVLGTVSASKDTYRMNIVDLIELKSQGRSTDLGNTFWQANLEKNQKTYLSRGLIKPSTELL